MSALEKKRLPQLPSRVDSAKEFGVSVTPSQYLHDRKLPLPDKLSTIASAAKDIKISAIHSSNPSKPFTVPMNSPLFEPFPHEINLQNFTPFQNYEVVISFRNSDRVSVNFISNVY